MVDQTLTRLGFNTTHYVAGRATIADLFKPQERCGIYVLHFADGMYYAGQSVEVTRRYHQHKQAHTDIEKISFKHTARDVLDTEEKSTVEALESEGFRLRNINLVSAVYGETDFDLIMSSEEQDRWLKDDDYVDLSGKRFEHPDLRARYTAKYKRFMAMPDAEQVITVLRAYAQRAIPVAGTSEVAFWCVTCLPPGKDLYARVNINWQEVVTAYSTEILPKRGLFRRLREPDREVGFSFHLARSPLDEKFGSSLRSLIRSIPGRRLQIWDHQYKPGGQDQKALIVLGAEAALELLNNRTVIDAMRLFNLRLMRKGTCGYKGNHCLDLADRLLD